MNLKIAIRFTLMTTLLLGLVYPLAMTGLSQLIFPRLANGSLITKDSKVVGSRLIGQQFTGDAYFHPRPSAAGSGYDATSSGGSNLAPTNRALVTRVEQDVAAYHQENPGLPIPADLVTSSASGLDPHISPASAEFQLPRVASARHMEVSALKQIVGKHTEARQFGFLGEARVNALELNLELDALNPVK